MMVKASTKLRHTKRSIILSASRFISHPGQPREVFSIILTQSRHALLHIDFFFQAEDDIRFPLVTGVLTCALPISEVADAVIRLTMSYMVMPTDPPQMVARRLARLAVGFFADRRDQADSDYEPA